MQLAVCVLYITGLCPAVPPASQPATVAATQPAEQQLDAEDNKKYQDELRIAQRVIDFQQTKKQLRIDIQEVRDHRDAQVQQGPAYRSRSTNPQQHQFAENVRTNNNQRVRQDADGKLDDFGQAVQIVEACERASRSLRATSVHLKWGFDKRAKASFRSGLHDLRHAAEMYSLFGTTFITFHGGGCLNSINASTDDLHAQLRALVASRPDLLRELLSVSQNDLSALTQSDSSSSSLSLPMLSVADAWLAIEHDFELAPVELSLCRFWLSYAVQHPRGRGLGYGAELERLSTASTNPAQ